MQQTDFALSRRQILGGIGTISIASVGAGVGTSAYFSDQETFENNELTAGELDLKVDWQQTYNGDPVNAFPDGNGDDIQDEIRTRQEIATDAGLPVDSPSVETTFREQFADVPDDRAAPLIELTDLKPGDEGELTFSLHLFDNPGYIWIGSSAQSSAENGFTEPELDDPDEVDSETTPPESRDGDLIDRIEATLWYDDGDNQQEDGETTVLSGTLRTVLCRLNAGIALDADPSTGARDCFEGDTTRYLGLRWSLPVDHANEVQGDSVTFDLGFATEQCRHNDGANAPYADGVVTPGGSIQSAVDAAAPGDVIKLRAGTYVEQVVVDKPLALVGEGQGETIIESPTSLDASYDRPLNGSGTATEYPVVLVDGVEVELCSLTVDGARNASGNANFNGIGLRNAGGRIVDVETVRTTKNPFDGAQHGNGIVAHNTDGTARRVSIRESTVRDYQKNGITGEGDGLTLIVSDTTVTGQGATDENGQNGIQLSDGAAGYLSRNVVTGNIYTGSTYTATGVIGVNAERIVLSENRLASNQFGLAASATDVLARRNDIVNDISATLVFPPAGVANYGGGTVDARYNWWGDASGPSETYGAGTGTDPVTGATPNGSGAGVVGAQWDPFLTSPVTQ
jgi:predicted ribosomally synthesized peptide with SipW-like signal peptide